MSLAKLIGRTVFDLALAVFIGLSLSITIFAVMFGYRPAQELAFCHGLTSLGVPLTAPGLSEKFDRVSGEWRYQLEVDCHATPADDQALVAWLTDRAPFEVDRIKRLPASRGTGGTAAVVRLSLISSSGQQTPAVPWGELGYKLAAQPPLWVASEPFLQDGPPRAVYRLITLGLLQIGFVVVGLVRCWRNARASSNAPPLRRDVQALPAALGVAIGLTGLFWVYVQAARFFFPPSLGVAESLSYIPSLGWFMVLPHQEIMMTVQPPFVQLVAGVVVVLGFPLAQEIFFRGGLVRMWLTAGRFWTGAVLSALAAAVFYLDWTLLPVVFVAGSALAWLYRWSGSLLATLLAHVLFNAAILCMVYGLIPALPHPVDQLCGQWEEVSATDPKAQAPAKKAADKTPLAKPADNQRVVPVRLIDFTGRKQPVEIEFLRGGVIRGGRVISPTVQLTPLHYQWVGPDEIEVRWERVAIVGDMAMNVTLELVRCQVAVNWEELTLTRASDGRVFRYRRDQSVYRGKVATETGKR